MRRLIVLALTMCLLVCAMPDVNAELQRSPVLDAALSMLEEDNLFLRRYNKITGASVEPYFKLGVPYFFGGVREQWLFAKYPDYMTRECWENTTYYVKGQVYIMGWDCAGFTQWVWEKAGRGKHASISKIIGRESHNRHLLCDETLLVPDWDELHTLLQPGDLLGGTRGSGYHIMLYIGTLRDFGFTAEEVPELRWYLDYPLVIHCSMNPAFGPRFQQFIDETGGKYTRCKTTDGGVCVALLGLSFDQAPHHEVVQLQEQAWFELDSGRLLLTLVDADTYTRWAWYR